MDSLKATYNRIKQVKDIVVIVFLLLFGVTSFAQKDQTMLQYEEDLNQLFEQAFTAKIDNERFNANEQAMLLLEEALKQPNSFSFEWNNLKKISILKSDDNKFKIFTWAIVRDNDEYDCFGFIQSLNPKTDEYDVYALSDRSQDIFNAEESILDDANWYGVVYYNLITTKHEDRTYYTLLGWTGNDCVKQKKVIETITFKSTSSKPTFGQSIFYRDKNRKRVVFEYSKEAAMILRYDKQSYDITEKKRVKNKTVKTEKTIVSNMIIFDVLQPMVSGMDGVKQFYIPSGDLNAYVFKEGRWHLVENVEAGLNDKKIEKFKPTEKPSRKFYNR